MQNNGRILHLQQFMYMLKFICWIEIIKKERIIMKSFKRLLSLFLCVLLLVGSAVNTAAESISSFYIKMTSVYNVTPGQITSFDVTVGDFTKLPTSDGGYMLEIQLPEVVSFISVEQNGRELSLADDEYGLYNENVVIFTDYFNLKGNANATGELTWTINVIVNSNAEMGYYSIGFYTPPMIMDGNENEMDIDISTGNIVIGVDEQNLIGDTDNDGAVLAADLVPMRKELLALENLEFSVNNADMNLDGKVDLKDLVILKKYLIDSFIVFNETKISENNEYSFAGNGYIYQITQNGEEVISFAEQNEDGEYEYVDVLSGAGKFVFKNSSKNNLLTYNGIKNYTETKTSAGTELVVTYNATNNNGAEVEAVTTYLFHENGINVKSSADLGEKVIASGSYDRTFLNDYVKTEKKINYNWIYPDDNDYPYQEYESIATLTHFDNKHYLYTFNRDSKSATYHYLKNYPEVDFNLYGISDKDADGVISSNEAVSNYELEYDLCFVNQINTVDTAATALFGSQQSDVSVRVALPAAHDDNSSVFVGDKANLDIVVKNIIKSDANYSLSYNIYDYYGNIVDEYSVTNAVITAGEELKLPIEVSNKYGIYYLNLEFNCGEFSYKEYYPFILFKEHTFTDGVHFGINALHANTMYEENTGVNLCNKMGIDIVRVGTNSLRLAKKLDAKDIKVYAQFGADFTTQENIDTFVEQAEKMRPYAMWYTFANEFDTGVKSNDVENPEAIAKAQVRMDEFKTKYYNQSAIAAFKENNLPISWNPTCHANNVWFKLMNDEGIWADSAVIDTHMYSITKVPDNKYHYNGDGEMYCNENSLERLKAAAQAYGDDKLFAIGETGYYTSSLDLRTHADFNTRTGILSLAYGADIVNFYCMYDRTSYFTGTSDWNEMHFGAFYNYDFYGVTKPKPWAAAYGTMTRLLDGVDSVEISEKYDNYEEEYRMTNEGGNTRAFDVTMENGETMIAAWTNIYAVPGTTSKTLGSDVQILPWQNQWLQTEEVTFDAAGDTVTVIDTMGNTTEYTPVNGKVTIPLTGSPVYIKGVN